MIKKQLEKLNSIKNDLKILNDDLLIGFKKQEMRRLIKNIENLKKNLNK